MVMELFLAFLCIGVFGMALGSFLVWKSPSPNEKEDAIVNESIKRRKPPTGGSSVVPPPPFTFKVQVDTGKGQNN